MAKYRIACLPGDGVGPEVMEAAEIALRGLRFDAELVHGDIGWEFWRTEGDALPPRTLELLQTTRCALFGAVTSKSQEEAQHELAPPLQGTGLRYHSPIVRLRQELHLHTNVRPAKAYPGARNLAEGVDIVTFRENTEGLYAGIEFHPLPDDVLEAVVRHAARAKRLAALPREQVAVSLRVVTEPAARSIAERAFAYAAANGRKRVTLVEKPHVLRETGGLMVRQAREVAARFPAIEYEERNVDAACLQLVRHPKRFEVLIAANDWGDVVSDLCAALVGGLGFAPSANLGDDYAVFEPTHGSAPEIAGQKIANPTAMLLSVKMMLDWLGERRLARRLEDAVEAVIRVGTVRTLDMGGSATTKQFAEEVVRKL